LKQQHCKEQIIILPIAIDRMPSQYLDNAIIGKCFIESHGIINTLPDEILLQIFMYTGFENISSIAKTCTHWACLCKDLSLWNYFKKTSRAVVVYISINIRLFSI